MPSADLPKLAREFTGKIRSVLDSTVCDGSHLAAIVRDSNLVLVGHGLSSRSLESKPFAVRTKRGRPRCWLDIQFRLCLDDERSYLTVLSSFFGIYADAGARECLCHFDHERGKKGYPEAHVQVHGESAALASLLDSKRGLDRLHFPVGGRRFRPILEDVIEFLIAEGLANGRDGWENVIRAEREAYYRIQLRAAVRRDPEIARQALADSPR